MKVTDTKTGEVHFSHSRKPAENKRKGVTIMGWAKYDEDIREAMEDRWVMRDTYRPVSVYSNDNTWRKQNTTQYPASIYSQQRATTPYTYRTVR